MTKSILQHENLCSSSWSVFQSDRVFCSNNNNPVATNKLLCLRRRWSVFYFHTKILHWRQFRITPSTIYGKQSVDRQVVSHRFIFICFSFWCYDFLAPFSYCYFHTSYSPIASGKKGLVAAVVVPSCELIFLFILIDLAHLYCPIGNSLERSDVAIKVHMPWFVTRLYSRLRHSSENVLIQPK